MKIGKTVVIFVVIGMLVGILSGCLEKKEESSVSQVTSNVATTRIYLGDDPYPYQDFKNIYVTFSEVKLHEKDAGNDTGWVSVLSNSTTVDLLQLHTQNMVTLLGLGEIAVGNYTELRIVVENASGVLNASGETIYLDVPSGELKIKQLFKLDDGNNNITINIDLTRSILNFGNGEKYKLLPVLSRLEHTYENHIRVNESNESKLNKEMTGNKKPVIDIVVNGSRRNNINIESNETIIFNASETYDFEEAALTYTWDFGDGTNGTGASVNHTFTGVKNQTFTVTLTVNDGTDDATATVTVKIKDTGAQGGNGNGNGGPS